MVLREIIRRGNDNNNHKTPIAMIAVGAASVVGHMISRGNNQKEVSCCFYYAAIYLISNY